MFAAGLLALAMSLSSLLVDPQGNDSILLSVTVSFTGYLLSWMVLAATGFAHRLLPTVSSLMACGSILTICMVATFVLLSPLIGSQGAAVVAWLILIWSVPVKGHIIARAIERHWYVGIAIALAIFIVQRVTYDALTATPGT